MDTSETVSEENRTCEDCEWFQPHRDSLCMRVKSSGRCSCKVPVWSITNVPIEGDEIYDAKYCETFKPIKP